MGTVCQNWSQQRLIGARRSFWLGGWCWSCSWMVGYWWWWQHRSLKRHPWDCKELPEGHEKVEDGLFHQDDDTTYSHCRVCEASHPFPSSLYMQMAMFKCQPCNCLMHGQRHLLWHHHLPPSKVDAHHGQYTLLDNEAVLHTVQRYLTAQNLGTITPHLLCRHVNDVLLALEMTKKNGSISEHTAINWLKKLGYVCKDIKKGVYHDGHECPDVVEARKRFLEEMKRYKRWVVSFNHIFDGSHVDEWADLCVSMMTSPLIQSLPSWCLGKNNMFSCLRTSALLM